MEIELQPSRYYWRNGRRHGQNEKLIANFRHWFKSRTSTSVFQGFWHGEPLAAIHWACLRSFLEAGHEFDLYTYYELDVPKGVRLKNAAEVVPREEMFFLQNPHTNQPDVAPFADYFRLKLLYEQGGWWCDVDTIFCSGNLPKSPRVWARQAPEYRPDSVSNGQLYFEKKDWVAKQLLRACEESLSKLDRRESLGPELISRVLNDLNLPLDMGATAETFYPIRYIEIFKLWLPEFYEEVEERAADAVFLPVYQSFPTHLGFDNKKLPPKGSYLHKAVGILAPEFPNITHDAGEFRKAVRNWLNEKSDSRISRLMSVSRDDMKSWLSM